jgi:hypothetical protein
MDDEICNMSDNRLVTVLFFHWNIDLGLEDYLVGVRISKRSSDLNSLSSSPQRLPFEIPVETTGDLGNSTKDPDGDCNQCNPVCKGSRSLESQD